ncbi:MAG: hypothetical protein ACT4QE_20725, partial [Anaerolineales bacterium]
TVKGNLLPDGTVIAKKITRVASGAGCFATTVIVTGVNGDTLTLSDGTTITLPSGIPVTGELRVASVIVVQTCVVADGTVIVVSVIVIFQLEALPPTPTPGPTPTPVPTTPAPVSGCTTLLVITNGQVSFPSGTFVTVGGHELLMDVELKDDKSEVKIRDRQSDWEVKVEVKDGKIEIKTQGSVAVGGAGTYGTAGTLTVQACAGQTGLVIVIGGIVPPPSGDVIICHKPDKKSSKTMTVPASALGGHLGHGDTLGPCAGGDGDDGDDDDD